MKSSKTTVTINTDYLTIARRYAELAGMSLKEALEYAIDRCLSVELEDYLKHDDDTEVEAKSKSANALLPEGWCFNVCSFTEKHNPIESEALIGLNFGLGGIMPTYVSIEEADVIKRNLEAIALTGGKYYIGNKSRMGDLVRMSRRGNGIVFQKFDRTTNEPIGVKASIASSSATRIGTAFDSIMSAARLEQEKNKP